MTAPNATPALTEPCGCSDALLCMWHAAAARRKGLIQRKDETGREFLRRVLATNPTLSQRVARRRKWAADIRVNGARKRLGRFVNETDAARAYDAAAAAHFGEFARLNFA
ncbi:MAG TPA: hypothetical protein VN607_09385, partial [Gemmatimonadaceae bacterium]|nr:hypothetical protein [Gemmatimonadaceae bacterium]